MVMWKKILIMLFTLIGTISFVYGYYSHNISASLGVQVLDTRDTTTQGSKFIFGSYNGKDVEFELLKEGVNGGALAMSYGSVRRTTLCKGACIGTTINYADTTLFETENAVNNSLNAAANIVILGNVFIPSATEIFTGGIIGAGFGGTLGLNAGYLKAPSLDVYTCDDSNRHVCDTGLPCEVTCTWDNVWIKQSSYTIPSTVGGIYAPVYSTVHPSLASWKYWEILGGQTTYFSYAIRPAVILDTSKIAFAFCCTIS